MLEGRELDWFIAEKIFGYKKEGRHFLKEENYIVGIEKDGILYDANEGTPSFSNNMNDAWLLVDWVLNKGYTFCLEKIIKEKCWEIRSNNFKLAIGTITRDKTPEMAICKLALKLARDK